MFIKYSTPATNEKKLLAYKEEVIVKLTSSVNLWDTSIALLTALPVAVNR